MARVVAAVGVVERRSGVGGVVFGGHGAAYSVRRRANGTVPRRGQGQVSPGSVAAFSHVWRWSLGPSEKAAWNALGVGRVSGIQVGQRWRSEQDT